MRTHHSQRCGRLPGDGFQSSADPVGPVEIAVVVRLPGLCLKSAVRLVSHGGAEPTPAQILDVPVELPELSQDSKVDMLDGPSDLDLVKTAKLTQSAISREKIGRLGPGRGWPVRTAKESGPHPGRIAADDDGLAGCETPVWLDRSGERGRIPAIP